MSKNKVAFNSNVSEIAKDLRDGGQLLLEALARETRTETVKNILRGSVSGRMYRVPGTSVMYQASAPGEAPANRLGQLANSYDIFVTKGQSAVYSNVKHARIEMGYGAIAPRPHLRPASDKVMSRITSIISRVYK